MRHSLATLFYIVSVILVFHLCGGAARGQGTQADYKRSDALYASRYGSVTGSRVFPHWTGDGNAFWYVSIDSKWKQKYWWVDVVAGTRKPAFDHARLAAALKAAQIITIDPDFLAVDDISHDDKGNVLLFMNWMKVTLNPANYAVKAEKDPSPRNVLARLNAVEASDLRDQGDDYAIIRGVTNNTSGPISIERVQPDGTWEECAHGLVGDTGTTIYTYSGQVFVAIDAKKKVLGAYRVDGNGGAIVVDPPGGSDSGLARLFSWLAAPTTRPTTAPTVLEPGESPDLRWIAFIKKHNVWLRDRRNGREFPLSTTGRAGYDFPVETGFTWSPSSNSVLALQRTSGASAELHWVESSPPDQLRQKLESSAYVLPGDPLPLNTVHIFDVNKRAEIPITGLEIKDPEFMSIGAWGNDPPTFGLYFQQRGHQTVRVIAIDATTGKARTIVDEHSNTFIDARSPCWRYAPDTHELYFMSERDGWNHLYRYDTVSGELLNQVTKGQFVVGQWDQNLDEIKAKDGDVYFHACGVDPDQDPYYVHYCWSSTGGTGMIDLTPGDGTHEVQRSTNGEYFLDTYSRVDQPPITELRHFDGKMVCPLEKADASELLASGWKYPERFSAKGRDGSTDIYGVIYRPSNFDPAKKYPVVEDIYAFPQTASVPKAFTRWNYAMTVAELGFIVVQIDGMGTPDRGKAFSDVCWHNLRDCGFYDRIAWMQAAAAAHPEMDLSRVGIYGSSGGGYAALRALEDHGDFYKVAVADDGPHDPRLYQQWYIERYMGWPVGPWYAEQSNAEPTAIARMNGKLLLMVSEEDHNVQPANTMRVVDALIKANKDFDFLQVPNADHCGGGDYIDRRRKDFLVRNLLGVQPRGR